MLIRCSWNVHIPELRAVLGACQHSSCSALNHTDMSVHPRVAAASVPVTSQVAQQKAAAGDGGQAMDAGGSSFPGSRQLARVKDKGRQLGAAVGDKTAPARAKLQVIWMSVGHDLKIQRMWQIPEMEPLIPGWLPASSFAAAVAGNTLMPALSQSQVYRAAASLAVAAAGCGRPCEGCRLRRRKRRSQRRRGCWRVVRRRVGVAAGRLVADCSAAAAAVSVGEPALRFARRRQQRRRRQRRRRRRRRRLRSERLTPAAAAQPADRHTKLCHGTLAASRVVAASSTAAEVRCFIQAGLSFRRAGASLLQQQLSQQTGTQCVPSQGRGCQCWLQLVALPWRAHT